MCQALTNSYELVTVNLADVERKPVRWLWPDRIPMGGFTLFVGVGGLGKSVLSLDIASRVTSGAAWPDGVEKRTPGGVILLTAEDNLSDVVGNRVDAAEGLSKSITVVKGTKRIDEDLAELQFDIRRDIKLLQDLIDKQGNTQLVIIDPVPSFMGKADSHKNAETRSVLSRLAILAEKKEIAIICITHLNKNTSQDASNRIIGSVAFNNAARAVWHIAPHPDDKDLRLFLPGKNNLCKPPDGMAFRLLSKQNGEIQTVRIEYETETVYMDIDEVLSPKRGNSGNAITKVEDAVEWLKKNCQQVKDFPIL